MLHFISITLCHAQKSDDGYEIFGVIKGIGNTKVLLGNKPTGYTQAFKIKYYDSCISHNDTFFFKGQVKEPCFYSIEVLENKNDWRYFIIENSKIIIKGNKDSVWTSTVQGSAENDMFADYRKNYLRPLLFVQNKFFDLMDSSRSRGDTISAKIFRDSVRAYSKWIVRTGLNYIKSHPKNFTALYILEGMVDRDIIPLDTAKYYFSLLSEKFKSHSIGQNLYYRIFDFQKALQVNSPLPEFNLPDTNGTNVSLSDFKGKYLILAFWASWCGPCIRELPELKKIYSNYPHSKLEILGISIDTEENNWKKSVIDHSIPWVTVCDLEGNESKVSQMFNLISIPKLYLIDPEGKLVLNDVSMGDLESALSQRLK